MVRLECLFFCPQKSSPTFPVLSLCRGNTSHAIIQLTHGEAVLKNYSLARMATTLNNYSKTGIDEYRNKNFTMNDPYLSEVKETVLKCNT